VLGLVRLTGATRLHHLKRKDRAGHVEYRKAQCGESRTLRLGGGKERKFLPIRTKGTSDCDLASHLPYLMRTIKEEEVDLTEYENYADVVRHIGRFLDEVYMQKRIHSSLG
jgi:hypothetical protein